MRIPPPERFGKLESERSEVQRRVGDLERTDGSQYGRLLEKVRTLVAGLAAQVEGYITSLSYTRPAIDAKWAVQDAAITTLGTSKEPAFGVLGAGKGGTATANVYSTTSTGTQLQVYVRPDGMLTVGASSERYKQDIADLEVDLDALLSVRPRQFRWKAEVEAANDEVMPLQVLADDGGQPDPTPDAPVVPFDYGLIAEELEAVGSDWLVRRDPDGTVQGVHYHHLPVALLAIVQRQQQQIDDLTARLRGQGGGD